jgi:hypothetical protein
MSLDRCIDALRFRARSSDLEATRLMTAELRIREFLAPAGSKPEARRAALKALDDAVVRESEFGTRGNTNSFWLGSRDYIAPHLAAPDGD